MESGEHPSQAHRVAGLWKFCDGFSAVEYAISIENGLPAVRVIDASDGESPEVMDVSWIESKLQLGFAVHWSHGRLCRYQVSLGPRRDRVEAIITSTHQELWERVPSNTPIS